MFLEAVLGFCLVWLLYKLWCEPFDYWESRKVPCVPATSPIGSLPSLVVMEQFQGHVFQNYYDKLAPHPWGGFYVGREPHILARSPDFIRRVMAKDFQYFRCRGLLENNSSEILFHHLFNLEGEKWKAVRTKLTPTFTSGKLKMMFQLFESCAEQLKNLLVESEGKEINIKDISARFTTDIIASCAFGLDVNTMSDPNHPFRHHGSINIPNRPPLRTKWRIFLNSCFPKLKDFYSFRVFTAETERFFVGMVRDAIEYRTENKVRRNDFIDLLMDLKKEKVEELSSTEKGNDIDMDLGMMAAQCFVFFVAGFETSSSVQSYLMYELCKNQDVQTRLYDEIVEVTKKHDGKITYESLKEMTYLEQTINESMRLYPTLPILTRVCSEDYRTEEGPTIEKGIKVHIPIYVIQRDSDNFTDPETFDPDRFSKENKDNIKPYSFLPFGEGPRNCIGMRFGMMQTKLGIVTILRKYKVVPTENTPKKLKFNASTVIAASKGPINLKLISRDI